MVRNSEQLLQDLALACCLQSCSLSSASPAPPTKKEGALDFGAPEPVKGLAFAETAHARTTSRHIHKNHDARHHPPKLTQINNPLDGLRKGGEFRGRLRRRSGGRTTQGEATQSCCPKNEAPGKMRASKRPISELFNYRRGLT